MTKKYYAIFLAIILTGTTLYYFVAQGYFPVVIVNGHMISEKEYEQSLKGVVNYYLAVGKTYKDINIESVLNNKSDVKKLAFEQVIENTIIAAELKRRLGSGLEPIVQQKLGTVKKTEDLSKAAAALYGMNINDFAALYLRPVAERELLDGKLLLEKSDITTWLKTAKLKANVKMLVLGYSWQNGEVKSKGSE